MGLRGFKALSRRIRDADMVKALTPVMNLQGDRLKFAIEEEAPVRTGRLRDSFTVKLKDSSDRIIVEYQSDAPYAQFVIRGTRYQVANNFPERAFKRMIPEMIEAIVKETRQYTQGVIDGKRK